MSAVEIVQDINRALLEATLATTAALLLVMLVRRRLRTLFGASVAYAAWLLIPIVAVAMVLPAAPYDAVSSPAVYGFIAQPMQAVIADAEPGVQGGTWLGIAWLLGTLTVLVHFVRQQRRFRGSLGRLFVRHPDVLQADAVAGLPAALGWLNPVVVLPADFETRYSAEQRALMLAHERAHIRHGDLQANAVCLALRCVFWFNPLLHVAARAFRHDQELACDQRVISRHPQSRRAYGEAMFNTQLAAQALPLGCHWGFTHPLKERIEMLTTSMPSHPRRAVGASLVAIGTLFAATLAWAAQPPTSGGTERTQQPPTAIRGQSMAPPAYPKAALAERTGGKVVLLVDVAADGSVARAVVDHADPAGVFDDAALESVKTWKFVPATKNGKPVAGRVRIPVEFRPDGAPDKSQAQAQS